MRRFVAPLITILIIGTLSVFQHEVLLDTWNRLTSLHPVTFLPLAIAAIVMITARAAFLASCSPGVSIRQAVVADQSALAAGYGIALGGGAVGTGMRIHMFSAYGLTPLQISASIIATAVVPSFTTWGLPMALLAIPTITGTASDIEQLAVIAGTLLIAVSILFWWGALRTPKVFLLVGRVGYIIRAILLRRLPRRLKRARIIVESTEPTAFSAEMRTALIALLRTRWYLILLSSAGTLAAGYICLWTSSIVFGAQGLEWHEALIAFSLIRVLIALSPIPGGTGIAEIGLIALLERAGVSSIDAAGTTILYRFLTWFIPIVVGTVCWWRYNHPRQETSNGPIHHNDSQFENA
jgi:uncharacterized membrane protein YbhN (UPF0104 family)